ncbi:MAG: DNA-binding protein [Pseudonocardiaceae bacterium]|nr:MAG: DNA-binding protein [Pseudonocardiaceae bacterium]
MTDKISFENRCFTINEAADLMRVGRSTIYNLIAAGDLKPRKIGSRTILLGSELRRFLDHSVTAA